MHTYITGNISLPRCNVHIDYVHLVQVENGAISLVLLQTAEILGLKICFAIHFLCVTIE